MRSLDGYQAPGPRLSPKERACFLQLLARFVEHDLVETERWRVEATWGDVFLALDILDPGVGDRSDYRLVWPPDED